jgi:hypothetical protein
MILFDSFFLFCVVKQRADSPRPTQRFRLPPLLGFSCTSLGYTASSLTFFDCFICRFVFADAAARNPTSPRPTQRKVRVSSSPPVLSCLVPHLALFLIS